MIISKNVLEYAHKHEKAATKLVEIMLKQSSETGLKLQPIHVNNHVVTLKDIEYAEKSAEGEAW